MLNDSFPERTDQPASDALPLSADGLDPDRVSDLIDMIKESADKLAADRTSRGDLKILSRTLRELRYAFKVFAPYRGRRKVTVFGSARTRPHDAGLPAGGRASAGRWPTASWLVVTGAASGIMEAGHRRRRPRELDGPEHHAPLRADRQRGHRAATPSSCT